MNAKDRSEVFRNLTILEEILRRRDVSEPSLQRAARLLSEISDAAFGSRPLPSELPHKSFFFGLHDGELGSIYLNDSELMNSIAALDAALKRAS